MNDMLRLIEPLIPALRRYARTLLRDRTSADDLVQDCLEHAIGRWHQRRPDGDTRAWVFTILHNLAMTRLRQSARQPTHVPIDEAGDALPGATAPQEDRLRHRDLLNALGRLPDEQRAILLLIGVEELSYADAAAVLGIPLGTVMSRLSRARDRLWRETSSDGAAAYRHLRRVK
jgi:RNA polymerase sigma-70 factor (ECF subfamily)